MAGSTHILLAYWLAESEKALLTYANPYSYLTSKQVISAHSTFYCSSSRAWHAEKQGFSSCNGKRWKEFYERQRQRTHW